jgi:hypothetical protein
MVKLVFFSFMLTATSTLADEAIPFPFEGLYESRGGMAREQLAPGEWRDIPQEVQMRITRQDNIVKLSLRIEAQSTEPGDAQATYTIANDMWLVPKTEKTDAARSGRVEFDIYKLDRSLGRFEDRGDGYCQGLQCRYGYVTTKPNHQQRYHSHITWEAEGAAGSAFRQSGGLSIKPEGEAEWITFKTWINQFTRSQ